MTGKGGSEGFMFSATRVLPAEGKIEARGNYKRRKVESGKVTKAEQIGQIDTTTAVEESSVVKTEDVEDQ